MEENKSKKPGCGGLFMIALLLGVPYGLFFHIVLGWSTETVIFTGVIGIICIYIYALTKD
jgi:hypothetical protein